MKYPQLVSMPSAVSDWLEQQLEARGIDSEVYTRYILSLLHAHTLDVIYPEEDLPFTQLKKDGGRSATTHKRFRRTGAWWRHSHADAEQIKRSAAVECLMSAAEQSCEIESLVDELCEKLKEVNSQVEGSPLTKISSGFDKAEESRKQKKVTPKELAEKYYAAFPPLCQKEESSNFESNLNLVSSKWSSPEKSSFDLLAAKWTSTGSPKKSKKKPKRQSYENNMKSSRTNQNRGRFAYGYKRTHCVRNLSREMADNLANWEFVNNNEKMMNNNNNNIKDQCLESHHFSTATQEEDIDMYEDLPVDISDLLDDSSSPGPSDNTVDMMNLANMRDTGRRGFISCGTNITSSIWSNDEGVGLQDGGESLLDFKFGSISIDGKECDAWPDFNKQNEANSLLENRKASSSSVFEGFRSLPADIWGKTDTITMSFSENECLFDMLTISFMKINHSKEKSAFGEVVQRPQPVSQPFRPFGRPLGPPAVPPTCDDLDADNEDLLTSEKSHFRPIKESPPKDYKDGSVFVIRGSLDKIEYKRSSSGSMFIETEFGQCKRYREYHPEEPDFDFPSTCPKSDFMLKFCVNPNDQASQTEEIDLLASEQNFVFAREIQKTDTSDTMDIEKESDTAKCSCKKRCGCFKEKKKAETGKYDYGRPDSVFDEVVWKYKEKSCKKCNKNDSTWNLGWSNKNAEANWNSDNLKNIWDGEEVCHTCLQLNESATPLTAQRSQLREDISQDGEQLLSDLSSLQKAYMESSLPLFTQLRNADGGQERKRRHSYMDNESDIWSFAARLQEDCLFKMSTLPTLRSVTL